MKISLIAALAENRVIGIENRLPWHLPDDLKRFRKLTTGHPIIMGRKTFESIGKPLPNRTNIVISRQAEYWAEGVLVVPSLEEAFKAAAPLSEEAFVIGGAEIYRLAIPYADRLYLTWIHREWEGDAFFPDWNALDFREVRRESHGEGADLPYSFVLLERI